jgi:hypothetical protein
MPLWRLWVPEYRISTRGKSHANTHVHMMHYHVIIWEDVLYKHYEEAKPRDGDFTTDVDQWEASQTKHSTFKTGAMDKPELVENYDYVFDESQTIQFVMDAALPGTKMSAADKLLQQQIDEAEKRGELFPSPLRI